MVCLNAGVGRDVALVARDVARALAPSRVAIARARRRLRR
jgi:hypothetical protein